jgi:hypothetical protein
MLTKNKLWLVAAGFLVLALSQVNFGKAQSSHELPAEDDLFWTVTTSMNRPDDTTACHAAIDALPTATLASYGRSQAGGSDAGGLTDDQIAQETRTQLYQMCSMIAQMPTEMESSMGQEGVSTNLFGMSDWHHVSGLYFEKAGMGRISFTNTLDFLSYRFFEFMNGFGDMVSMEDGYISLNAAMIPAMKNYGAQLTMYGLNLGSQIPDIYVDGKLATAGDISDISYDPNAGILTFTAKHFSSYRAVTHGSKVKTMKITKVTPKSIKYNAHKRTFKVTVKGKNLKRNAQMQCTLGFSSATKINANKGGNRVVCTFTMSEFSTKGYYPLTISIPGTGEVTKTNAVRIR